MYAMIEQLLVSENIVHVGALLYLAGFLYQNQLILRGLIIAGDFVYVLYFYFAPEVPLWGGIFWSTMFTVVNVAMIALILADKMHFRLGRNEKRLFELLGDLSPGQFRQFLRIGREEIAASNLAITQEGKPLDDLFFVLDRKFTIEKRGDRTVTLSDTFIGEIAFLLPQPASATVTLEPGTPYFIWRTSELKKLMQAKPDLGTSLGLAMNKKMAQKIALGGFLHETDGVELKAQQEPSV
jgi:hypothetical protein